MQIVIVAVLWTSFFLINFNVAMMIPLLPFIQRDVGLSTQQAGWVLAAFPVVALVANLALGPWIDRLGRKRFILIGACGSAALYLLTAASASAAALMACRAVVGVFMPMVGASVFAAIADYIPQADRARVTGYVTTAAPIAFLLSMSMGVVLGGLLAWQVPLLIVAGLAGLLAIGAARLPPTPEGALSATPVTLHVYRRRLLSMSTSGGTRLVFLAYFCWSAAVYVFLGLYPTWIVQRGLSGEGPGSIGAMLFIGELGGLLGAVLSGRLSRLCAHPLRACALAAFATALVVATVPFGHDVMVLQGAGYLGFAFGRDLMLALILGGAMLLIPAAQRGSLNAVMNAIYQTGATVGALISAWVYGMQTNFTANAGVSALLFVVCGTSLWRVSRRADAPTPA